MRQPATDPRDSIEVAEERPEPAELTALYESVGWTAYTDDPTALTSAIEGSACVVTARAAGGLVGLARAISDDASICYLQDILVQPEWRHRGVASQLVEAILERFAHVRQVVLLTDRESGQQAFYEALGFTAVGEHTGLRAFVRALDACSPSSSGS